MHDWSNGLTIVDVTGTEQSGDVLLPFAFEELVCRRVGQGLMPAVVHLWRHRGGFVMGARDRRLPNARAAVDRLEAQGMRAGVRHSGGAAVPLDGGVVNVSLILPKSAAAGSFREDFARMYEWIASALRRIGVGEVGGVAAGEIRGSYCPGDYDVSIGGRKFCGIAQRRQLHAFIVHAFVNVEGSGPRRAELVRDFYEIAAGTSTASAMESASPADTLAPRVESADPKEYPLIVPSTMASLSELMGPVQTDQFIASLIGEVSERTAHLDLITDYAALESHYPGLLLDMERKAEELREKYDRNV